MCAKQALLESLKPDSVAAAHALGSCANGHSYPHTAAVLLPTFGEANSRRVAIESANRELGGGVNIRGIMIIF